MVQWGFCPSVRLFEAAACGCPIVSDRWPGLETLFAVGDEILVAENSVDIITLLTDCDDAQLAQSGRRARERVLAQHSSIQRALEFENYVASISYTAVDSPMAVPSSAQTTSSRKWTYPAAADRTADGSAGTQESPFLQKLS